MAKNFMEKKARRYNSTLNMNMHRSCVHGAKSKGLRKVERTIKKSWKIFINSKKSHNCTSGETDFLATIQNRGRSISPAIFLDLEKFNGELYHTNATIALFSRTLRFSCFRDFSFITIKKKLTQSFTQKNCVLYLIYNNSRNEFAKSTIKVRARSEYFLEGKSI